MNDISKAARNAVSAARTRLLGQNPFFGVPAMELRLVEVPLDQWPWGGVPTAATDGVHLFYVPEYVMSLNPQQADTLVAHELFHCVHLDIPRMGGRNREKWNHATDHRSNLILQENGFAPLPGWLCNVTYSKMAAETIYTLLPDDLSPAPLSDLLPGGSGLSPAEEAAHRGRLREALRRGAAVARARGLVPRGMEELVSELLDTGVPWRVLLQTFFEECGPGDFSWEFPDEDALQRGIFMPTLWTRHRLGHVVLAADTSASVSGTLLQLAGGAISEVLEQAEPSRMDLLHVDAEVARHQELTADDLPLEFRATGRGGTDFRPAFEWVEREGVRPVCFIYVTDMEGAFPAEPPSYPVLWVDVSGRRHEPPPFGTYIRITE